MSLAACATNTPRSKTARWLASHLVLPDPGFDRAPSLAPYSTLAIGVRAGISARWLPAKRERMTLPA